MLAFEAGDRLRADQLPRPEGPVILTVEGAITHTNAPGAAEFDLAMLERLGLVRLRTWTPWTDGELEFEGVPAQRLMEAVGAAGSAVRASALNDFESTIPLADFARLSGAAGNPHQRQAAGGAGQGADLDRLSVVQPCRARRSADAEEVGMAVEISAGAVKSLLRPSWFSSYGLLAAAALLFTGSLVLSFQKLQQQHEIELQDFGMSFWLMSQADYELAALAPRPRCLRPRPPGLRSDALVQRFDIFWSRLPLLLEGPDSSLIRESGATADRAPDDRDARGDRARSTRARSRWIARPTAASPRGSTRYASRCVAWSSRSNRWAAFAASRNGCGSATSSSIRPAICSASWRAAAC